MTLVAMRHQIGPRYQGMISNQRQRTCGPKVALTLGLQMLLSYDRIDGWRRSLALCDPRRRLRTLTDAMCISHGLARSLACISAAFSRTHC